MAPEDRNGFTGRAARGVREAVHCGMRFRRTFGLFIRWGSQHSVTCRLSNHSFQRRVVKEAYKALVKTITAVGSYIQRLYVYHLARFVT